MVESLRFDDDCHFWFSVSVDIEREKERKGNIQEEIVKDMHAQVASPNDENKTRLV